VIVFGVARALGASGPGLTPTGHAHRLGTPDYMPPEQWDHGVGACDARSDVFSLGILLGELMAGTLPRTYREDPVEASTARSRSRRRRKPGDVVLPSQAIAALAERDPKRALEASRLRHETDATALGRALADRVDRLAERATCPDPLRRFRDAAEFAAALRSAG
jgi:serine/threonine protein kinase